MTQNKQREGRREREGVGEEEKVYKKRKVSGNGKQGFKWEAYAISCIKPLYKKVKEWFDSCLLLLTVKILEIVTISQIWYAEEYQDSSS